MPPFAMPGQDDGINLFTIIINILFGFAAGLIIFVGFSEVIAYGSKLATELIKMTGYGQQMAMFGIATTAAPYIVLAPIAGIAVKQLTAVRSIKSFLFFAGAVAIGIIAAHFGHSMIGL
jgi:hypothetical protein